MITFIWITLMLSGLSHETSFVSVQLPYKNPTNPASITYIEGKASGDLVAGPEQHSSQPQISQSGHFVNNAHVRGNDHHQYEVTERNYTPRRFNQQEEEIARVQEYVNPALRARLVDLTQQQYHQQVPMHQQVTTHQPEQDSFKAEVFRSSTPASVSVKGNLVAAPSHNNYGTNSSVRTFDRYVSIAPNPPLASYNNAHISNVTPQSGVSYSTHHSQSSSQNYAIASPTPSPLPRTATVPSVQAAYISTPASFTVTPRNQPFMVYQQRPTAIQHQSYSVHSAPILAPVAPVVSPAPVPVVQQVPAITNIPAVAHVPVAHVQEQHSVLQNTVNVAQPAIKTRTYEVRRPAIQKQFYDVEERIIVRPAGSVVLELDEPISKTQKGETVHHVGQAIVSHPGGHTVANHQQTQGGSAIHIQQSNNQYQHQQHLTGHEVQNTGNHPQLRNEFPQGFSGVIYAENTENSSPHPSTSAPIHQHHPVTISSTTPEPTQDDTIVVEAKSHQGQISDHVRTQSNTVQHHATHEQGVSVPLHQSVSTTISPITVTHSSPSIQYSSSASSLEQGYHNQNFLQQGGEHNLVRIQQTPYMVTVGEPDFNQAPYLQSKHLNSPNLSSSGVQIDLKSQAGHVSTYANHQQQQLKAQEQELLQLLRQQQNQQQFQLQQQQHQLEQQQQIQQLQLQHQLLQQKQLQQQLQEQHLSHSRGDIQFHPANSHIENTSVGNSHQIGTGEHQIIMANPHLMSTQMTENQHKFLSLLLAQGGITEQLGTNYGQSQHYNSQLDQQHQYQQHHQQQQQQYNLRSRIISASPAPKDGNPAEERVHTRRIVINQPLETVQEVHEQEPITKFQQVTLNHPTTFKTARVELKPVQTSVPAYFQKSVIAAPLAHHPVNPVAISYQNYHH